MSGNVSSQVSVKSPSNISHNSSEVISKVLEPYHNYHEINNMVRVYRERKRITVARKMVNEENEIISNF